MVDSETQVNGMLNASTSIKELTGGELFKNKSDTEKYQKMVKAMAVGAGAVTLYATNGDFKAAGVASSVMYTSANITESLASGILKRIDQHTKYSYGYTDLHDDLVRTANENEAYNNSVSFAVGKGSSNEPEHSLAVKLNGGYATGVSMSMKEGNQYAGFQPTDGFTPKRPFKVQDLSEFKTTNAHLSHIAEERKSLLEDEEADQKDQVFMSVYADQFKRLLDPLKDASQREDTYLDVTGAPYRYYEDSQKLYPTTIRYSGESLEQLMTIADQSAKRRNAGKGADYTIDMVDLTYAHGYHATDLREKSSKLTRPEYCVDEGHPDMQTNVNWTHNLRHLVATGMNGVKTFAQKVKERGTALTRRNRRQLDTVQQQMDEGLDALRVISPQSSASVAGARPAEPPVVEQGTLENISDEDAAALRRVIALNLQRNQQSVSQRSPENDGPSDRGLGR